MNGTTTQTTTATDTPAPVMDLSPPSMVGKEMALAEDVSSDVQSVPGAMEIQSPEAIVPVRPSHITDERDAELKEQAAAIVAAILENPSDIEMTAKLYALGGEAEAANSDNIALIDNKIGPVMKEIGTDSKVGLTLTQIKSQLDLVNPHVVGQTETEFDDLVEVPKYLGLFGKKMVNQIVSRLPVGQQEIMVLINERRDTIRDTIGALKQHLWEERDKAMRNAIELAQVANKLADTQDDLQEATYQGQLIWAGLNEVREGETDPVRKQSLQYLTTDLAMKVVDLQTVDQLNIQSRMGAETLVNNCRGIQMLVGRVTNTLLPSVQNALAVKAGAAQQAELAASARGITAAASETIAQTAGDIRRVSVDIAKQNTEAVVDLDQLEKAADEYEAMQAELDEVMQQAEANARGISNRMSALNERMRTKADPLTAARQAKEAAGV